MMGNFIKTQTEAAALVLSDDVSGAPSLSRGQGDTCVGGAGAALVLSDDVSGAPSLSRGQGDTCVGGAGIYVHESSCHSAETVFSK